MCVVLRETQVLISRCIRHKSALQGAHSAAEEDNEDDAGHQQAGADEDGDPDQRVLHPRVVVPLARCRLLLILFQVILLRNFESTTLIAMKMRAKKIEITRKEQNPRLWYHLRAAG